MRNVLMASRIVLTFLLALFSQYSFAYYYPDFVAYLECFEGTQKVHKGRVDYDPKPPDPTDQKNDSPGTELYDTYGPDSKKEIINSSQGSIVLHLAADAIWDIMTIYPGYVVDRNAPEYNSTGAKLALFDKYVDAENFCLALQRACQKQYKGDDYGDYTIRAVNMYYYSIRASIKGSEPGDGALCSY